MRRLLFIAALILSFVGIANAGDMKHPSLPPGIHNGEPCLFGQTGSGCGGGISSIFCAVDTVAFGQGLSTPAICSGAITLMSLTASVNNVITVTAPPYNAKGDDVTDDTAAIQSAIYAACGTTNPPTGTPNPIATKAVYLPTPSNCYLHSAPLRDPCEALELYGQTPSTELCQNYSGDALIKESWGTSNLSYGASLVPGPGHSLISSSGLTNFIDLGRTLNGQGKFHNLNYAFSTYGGFNIAFFMKATAPGNYIIGSDPYYPSPNAGSTTAGAFNFGFNGSSEVAPTINTSGGLITPTPCPAQTLGTVYEIELDWNLTTYKLWQGVPGGTAVLCSSNSSTNPPLQTYYESMLLPSQGAPTVYPDNGTFGGTPFAGAIDSLKIEAQTVHQSAYTVPTTKFADSYDGFTYYQTNFETSLDGTQIGYGCIGSCNPVYSTVLGTSYSIGYTASGNIHDINFCGSGNPTAYFIGVDGLFTDGGNNSKYTNVSCQIQQAQTAAFVPLDFWGNEYLDNITNPQTIGGMVGINYGPAFNHSIVINANIDNALAACFVEAGGGTTSDKHTACIDRGGLNYTFLQYQSSASFDNLVTDQEVTNTAYAGIWIADPIAPNTFNNSGFTSENNAPYITQTQGGYSAIFNGDTFGPAYAGVPAELIDCTSGTPNTPFILNGVVNSGLTPASNNFTSCPVVHGNDCRGNTTLVSGAGAFSSQCVFPSDVCLATAAHSTTAAQPTAGRAIAATIAFNNTTMTDSANSFTSADVGRKVLGNANVPANTYITVVGGAGSVTISNSAGVHVAPQSVTLAASTVLAGTGTDVVTTVCQ